MVSSSWSRAVLAIDAILRRSQGIEEFTADPDCVFRVSFEEASKPLILSDGKIIRPGDRVAQIHYWNEHMPLIPSQGPNAQWANLYRRKVIHSLRLLAQTMRREARFADIVAIFAAPAFSSRAGSAIIARLSGRIGFDVMENERWDGPIHALLDSLLIWALMRAVNPASARDRTIAHRRIQIWISRQKLLALYDDDRSRSTTSASGAALAEQS